MRCFRSFPGRSEIPRKGLLFLKRFVNPVRAKILETAEVFRSLSNDIPDCWDKILNWKKITRAELSRRTGITEKSISLIMSGQRIPTTDTIVLLCLAANIPSELSEHIMRISGRVLLMNTEEQVMYGYLLKHMYDKSFPEIREFLREIGSDVYLKIPCE